MSLIRDLILRLDTEEKDQRIKDEKDFEREYRKQEEMHRRLSLLKEESKNYMDNIVKALDQLTANQCAITHALEQRNNLTALSISHEYHGNVINLISIIVLFMNNSGNIQKSTNLEVNEFFKKVISSTATVKNNLQEMQSNVNQAQVLFYKINLLKKLLKM